MTSYTAWLSDAKNSDFSYLLNDPKRSAMITNYNRRKIGQVFLFVYKSESLQPLLDALGDIALDGEPLSEIPAPGTMVVAKAGLINVRGDDRDDRHPLLQKLGGIHNKAWRAVIKERVDSDKVTVELIDVGVFTDVELSALYAPTEHVLDLPLCGGWVQIRGVEISDQQRRFYRTCYDSAMMPKLFRKVVVYDAVWEDSGITASIFYYESSGIGPIKPLKGVVQSLQTWDYETAIAKGHKFAEKVVEDLNGYPAREGRINVNEIWGLAETEKYKLQDDVGYVETPDVDAEDNAKIWKIHVEKFTTKLGVLHWFPQIEEAFLLYFRVNGVGTPAEWARVFRASRETLYDITHGHHLDFQGVMREPDVLLSPAPIEILKIPKSGKSFEELREQFNMQQVI